MTVNVKIDYNILGKKILEEQLSALNLDFELINSSEIRFRRKLSVEERKKITNSFERYGIEILENQQDVLVQQIKDCVTLYLTDDRMTKKYNLSTYLANKLNYSYSYLSTIFSEATHSSIENFIILKKTDLAKQLMTNKNLSLTEIAFKLDYSSVAHLSAQFKKTTGLTPSAFQRIIKKRKDRKATP
jgi:AraC-like DNA-binding protein